MTQDRTIQRSPTRLRLHRHRHSLRTTPLAVRGLGLYISYRSGCSEMTKIPTVFSDTHSSGHFDDLYLTFRNTTDELVETTTIETVHNVMPYPDLAGFRDSPFG